MYAPAIGWVGMCVTTCAMLAGGPALADGPPEELRPRIAGESEIHLIGPRGTVPMRDAAVVDSGLMSRRPFVAARPALILGPGAKSSTVPPAFVPWSEIDSVQIAHRHALDGAKVGLAVALIPGTLALLAYYGIAASADVDVNRPLAATVTYGVCIGTCALIGWNVRSWHTAWRAPHATTLP